MTEFDEALAIATRRGMVSPRLPTMAESTVFLWHDSKNIYHPVDDMDTEHLFHVLRMIWNHSAPESLRMRPYNKYAFSEHYTPQYIADAVKYIGAELMTRDDLPPKLESELDHMRNHIVKLHELLKLETVKPNN